VSNGHDGYIDEYNQLRAEIRMYLEHSSKNLQIAMALGAAAVTFGSKYPNLLMVSALIAGYLWYDEIRHLRAVQRLASYLEVCVEPNVPGLNWETLCSAHPFETSFANRAIAHAPLPTLMVAQAIYAIKLAGYLLLLGSMGVGMAACCLIALSYLTAKRGREEERKRWQQIMQKKVSGTLFRARE
jgi:hypothetical protein